MPIIWGAEEFKAALSVAVHKRHNYLWLQEDVDSCSLYNLPWREVWSEPMLAQVADDLQKGQRVDGVWPVSRQVLSIINEPEKSVTRVFPYDRLMPVYYLNGIVDGEQFEKQPNSGNSMLRQVNRIQMLMQLRRISRGVFVISGGNDVGQWQKVLDEVFNAAMLADAGAIQVFLLGPLSSLGLDLGHLEKRRQEIYVWEGRVEDLVDYLNDSGSLQYTGHEILIGDSRVAVTEFLVGAVSRIDEEYFIIEAQDLEEVYEIDDDLFARFMEDAEPCWRGFAAGLYMNRGYQVLGYSNVRENNPLLSKLGDDKPFKKYSLTDLIERCLELAETELGGSWTITVPAEAGSGITTMLWANAFQMARKGYPVMVLKPGVRKIDYNSLTTFLTNIGREARRQCMETARDSMREVPALLVCDAEHQSIDVVNKLAALLYNDGRRCVVLRAVDQSDDNNSIDNSLRARGQEIICKSLSASVENMEITELRGHLLNIKERYGLGFGIPELNAWKEYQENSSIHIWNEKGDQEAESIFWVGLRFLLGNQHWSVDRLESQLMQNMEEVYRNDSQMACYLYSIAVATRFRLALPVIVLARAYHIEDWVKFSDDLNGAQKLIPYMVREYLQGDTELLRFRHTAFATVVIKQLNNLVRDSQTMNPEGFEPPRDFRYPVEWLHHLIANLRAGDDQERQFGNMVATQVLKLEGKKRQLRLFNEQMLECFNHFSDDFIQQNATVLQAKAITLSKSARLGQVSEEISRGRFEHAAELLKKALDLTDINGNMDEDPRVLKTTLANVYESWARSELEWRQMDAFDELAEEAAALYQEVFSDWPDNEFASYGYSQLLYHRFEAAELDEMINLPFEYLQDALECLDVKPDVGFQERWEYHRVLILRKMSEQKYIDRIEELMAQGHEIGYVLKARFILGEKTNPSNEALQEAITVLEQAEICRRPSARALPRLVLLYRLVSQHFIKRWDFKYRHGLLNRMESLGYRFGAQMLYEYAVLSYQLDYQDVGDRMFSILRRIPRSRQLQIGQYEFWRESGSGQVPPLVKTTTMTVEMVEGFRGLVKVTGIKQLVTFYAIHPWGNEMRPEAVTDCIIRFGKSGPLAIPPHFYREGGD